MSQAWVDYDDYTPAPRVYEKCETCREAAVYTHHCKPRIRVRYSKDGSLPKGVVLASIHEEYRGEGWYCITPGGVAHGPYRSERAFWLTRQWVHNFLREGQVDWEFCQPHQELS